MTIAELRTLLLAPDAAADAAVVRLLRRDPRRGARALADVLERRREADRAEAARIDRLRERERALWSHGLVRVAGVDEAGVGPLAGPVVAAAVFFSPGSSALPVDDSKRLAPERRRFLEARIRDTAAAVGIGVAEVREIDEKNIFHASALAMQRAVAALPEAPEHVLIDGRRVPGLRVPQDAIIGGDGSCHAIAAASILAKTHRDRLMEAMDARYPAYGFGRHKGYATAEHLAALRAHGPCPEHRRSFRCLDDAAGRYSPLFYALRARIEARLAPGAASGLDAALAEARPELAEAEWTRLRALVRRKTRR